MAIRRAISNAVQQVPGGQNDEQQWWQQALADVQSGARTDFSLKNPGQALPDFNQWASQNYVAPTFGINGRARNFMTNPGSGGTNPAEQQFLANFTNVPSYDKSGFGNMALLAMLAGGMGMAGMAGAGGAGATGATGLESAATLSGAGDDLLLSQMAGDSVVGGTAGSTAGGIGSEFSLGGGATGYGVGGNATVPATTGATQSGGSIWDKILGTGGPAGGGGMATDPRWMAGAGLLQILERLYSANAAKNAGQNAAERSDPFGPQRAFFQGELAKLFTDPNYTANSPGFKAGTDAVNRRSAKLGQMFSGNNAADLVTFAQGKQMDLANPLLVASGANINPGYAGFLQQQGDTAAQNNIRSATGNIVPLAKSIYDIFKTTQV